MRLHPTMPNLTLNARLIKIKQKLCYGLVRLLNSEHWDLIKLIHAPRFGVKLFFYSCIGLPPDLLFSVSRVTLLVLGCNMQLPLLVMRSAYKPAIINKQNKEDLRATMKY